VTGKSSKQFGCCAPYNIHSNFHKLTDATLSDSVGYDKIGSAGWIRGKTHEVQNSPRKIVVGVR
jgi:hypothetical protein